jgi:hypothetical protein
MPECRFVLTELIPLLYSLGENPVPRVVDASMTARMLVDLEGLAAELEPRLGQPVLPLESPDLLASWVGAPCAILGGAVIPLERIAARSVNSDFYVCIEGECYRFALEGKRTLQEFTSAVRRTASAHLNRAMRRDAELSDMATRFVREATSLIGCYRPQSRGSYCVLYRDEDHEVQHSQGAYVVVRGPVRGQAGAGPICIGLHIKGSTRTQWLAVPPRVSQRQDDFWIVPGDAARGGICVGQREQYRHLSSTRLFTRAEAVLHWLDAGCILATDRSAHRALLERRAGIRRHRRMCSRATGG